MPYKFQTDCIRLPKELDRRIKLFDDDKEKIKQMHKEGYGIREMARLYHVDKRLIQFVLFPERQELNKQLREARGGWRQYYDKKYNTVATREHRRYKSRVMREVLYGIKETSKEGIVETI